MKSIVPRSDPCVTPELMCILENILTNSNKLRPVYETWCNSGQKRSPNTCCFKFINQSRMVNLILFKINMNRHYLLDKPWSYSLVSCKQACWKTGLFQKRFILLWSIMLQLIIYQSNKTSIFSWTQMQKLNELFKIRTVVITNIMKFLTDSFI